MSPIIVGKVYADWCGYCTELIPEWRKLKSLLPNNVTFVQIEDSQKLKREKFEKKHGPLVVNGFPTIFKIHPGQKIEYYTSGARTAEAIKAWVLTNARKTKNNMRYTYKKALKNRRQTRKNTFRLF
jgi:thiol-disulfide isomerase/thioredoxin